LKTGSQYKSTGIDENHEQDAKPSKASIRTKFLMIKDSLDTVIYSLIRTKDFDLADELYLRIKDDKCTFFELASHSEGPEKDWGCTVGPCPLSQGHPELAAKLRSLPVGQLSKPFAIKQTAIIIRVEQRNSAKYHDWEERLAKAMASQQDKQMGLNGNWPKALGRMAQDASNLEIFSNSPA
jgi:pentatricopeptide repeat protein